MDIEALRDEWHRATEKNRPAEAIRALVALERALPKDPLWSQRLGEAYRRNGQLPEAVDAFSRACERFLGQGFTPRAIAMAKLVGSLDSARGNLLERLLPAPPAPAPRPMPKPAPLVLVDDADDDELRFNDSPESSVTILLVDLSTHDSLDVVVELDDADVVADEEPHPADDEPPTGVTAPRLDEARADLAARPPVPVETMAAVRLFASLSRAALVALAKAAELVEFVSGAPVIVRADPAHALYVIVGGGASVRLANGQVVELGEGDVFGEASLLMDAERQADVEASGPLMTLRIEKHQLDMVTALFPEVEDALFELLARRLITNLLTHSPLFTMFEPDMRFKLAQMFEVRRADAGTVIADRGRRSDGLYLLLAGNVVAEAEDGTARRLAPGSAFGHESLVGMVVANVTVRALTESVVIRMPRASFASFALEYPPALAHLAETTG